MSSPFWQKDERKWWDVCDNFSEPIIPTDEEIQRLRPKSSSWFRADGTSIAYCIDTNIFVRNGPEDSTKYFRVTDDSMVRRQKQRDLKKTRFELQISKLKPPPELQNSAMQPEQTTHFRLGNSFFPVNETQVVYKGKGVFEVESSTSNMPTQIKIKPECLQEVLRYIDAHLCCDAHDANFEFVWQEDWNGEEADADHKEKPAVQAPAPAQAERLLKFQVGDKVFAKDIGTDNWYSGRIATIVEDQYEIAYDGAFNPNRLPESHIVPQLPIPPVISNTWAGKKVICEGARRRKMTTRIIKQIIKGDDGVVHGFCDDYSYFMPLAQIVGVCQ